MDEERLVGYEVDRVSGGWLVQAEDVKQGGCNEDASQIKRRR